MPSPLPSPYTKNTGASRPSRTYIFASICPCSHVWQTNKATWIIWTPLLASRDPVAVVVNGPAWLQGEARLELLIHAYMYVLLVPFVQSSIESTFGGELTTADKTAKSNEAKKLVDFMEEHYDSKFKDVKSFDEFYHAIYEIIEMYCEGHGQFQYKIPDKKILEEQYRMARHPRESAGRNLKEEFIKIAENVFSLGSFTAGNAAIHVLTVLFGAPVCALFVKRVLPGLRSLSDDIVIPVATSGAVVYLAKTNKL